MVKLPWIPSEAEWARVLGVFGGESIRNRLMLSLAYDAALRREELCSLRAVDAGRLRVRETRITQMDQRFVNRNRSHLLLSMGNENSGSAGHRRV